MQSTFEGNVTINNDRIENIVKLDTINVLIKYKCKNIWNIKCKCRNM